MSFPRTDAGIFCKRDCRIKSDNDKFLEMETIVLHEGEYVLTSALFTEAFIYFFVQGRFNFIDVEVALVDESFYHHVEFAR